MSKKALEIAKDLLKHIQDKPESVQDLSKSIHAAAPAAPAPAPMKSGYFQNLAQKNQMGKAMPGMGMPKPTAPKPSMPAPSIGGTGGAGGPKGPGAPKPKPIVGNARKEELDKAKIVAGPGHAEKPGTVLADLPSKPTGDKGKPTVVHENQGNPSQRTTVIRPATDAKHRNAVRGKTAVKEAPKKKTAVAKAENPDKEADAKLGEQVEHDVEQHMKENAAAETKEGHKPWQMTKEEIKAEVMKGEIAKAGESKHDRCVEHVKENSPEVKNPHAVCVAEGVRPAKWKKMSKDEMKDDCKSEWKPKFMKSASAEGSKGIMANKIIKPSDVKDAGPASFAVSKEAAGLKGAKDGEKKK